MAGFLGLYSLQIWRFCGNLLGPWYWGFAMLSLEQGEDLWGSGFLAWMCFQDHPRIARGIYLPLLYPRSVHFCMQRTYEPTANRFHGLVVRRFQWRPFLSREISDRSDFLVPFPRPGLDAHHCRCQANGWS